MPSLSGRAFRVQDVIRGKRMVRLQREYTRNDTYPFVQKKIRLKQHAASDWGARLQQPNAAACRECGTSLPSGARFCVNCGSKME